MSTNMSVIDKTRSIVSRNNFVKKIAKVLFRPLLRVLENRSIKDYNTWLEGHMPTVDELKAQRGTSKSLSYSPLISVVVPVYNPPNNFFIEMIESVLDQTYDNWELILVDDASPDEWVRAKIQAYAKKDSRIKYLFLSENLHIAGATNKGIESALGEYIALLDNDDILQPNALFEVVSALNENQKLQFIYSDEDKIEGDSGRHVSPYFKPSWNPDFLYSVNYITHLAVIEKKLLKQIGGLDSTYNGAQDWELFLRIARSIDSAYIYHIPKILYSWRVHEASTASGIEAKPYVVEAQRKAIEADLEARNYKQYQLEQDSQYPAQWHVQYSLLEKKTAHIFVENKEQLAVLLELIKQDNASSYYSASLHKNELNMEIIKDVSSDYLLYIPRSLEIKSLGFVDRLIEDAQRPDVAFVIPECNNPKQIMENIKVLINLDALSYIEKTSARDVTKHFYSTTRYNVPSVGKIQAYCIEVKKLRQLLKEINTGLIFDASSVAENYNYRNLYNPYVSLL